MSDSTILTVGVGQKFRTIAAAVAAAAPGDIIDVMAGTYVNDFFTLTKDVTIVGIGGLVSLVATKAPPAAAIITVSANVRIQNLSVSGATAGAGIKFESGSLTLNQTQLSGNATGLLALTAKSGNITVQNSEISANGSNIAVGQVGTLTVQSSYIHDATTGDEILSRAGSTAIAGDRIIEAAAGKGGAVVLDQGGVAVISGNTIQTRTSGSASAAVAYSGAASSASPSALLVSGNTFTGGSTGANAVAVSNTTTITAVLVNNTVSVPKAGAAFIGPSFVSSNTILTTTPASSSSATPAKVSAPPPVAPSVASVSVTPGSALVGVGTKLSIQLNTTDAVKVTGTPILQLSDGGTATYQAGSGTKALTFTSVVAAGQNTPDLAITGVALQGGSIVGVNGVAADLAGAVVNPSGVLQVDGTVPTITGVGLSMNDGTIYAGQSVLLTVATSEPVTVTGQPTLTLNDGGTATFVSGSGTSALVFSTTVAAGQQSPGLGVTGVSLNGGSLTDAAGNAADLKGAAASAASKLVVAGMAPPPLASASGGVTALAVPQPSQPGDVVGLVLQNAGSTVLATRTVTFGQEFASGQVKAGAQLLARVGGVLEAVQMDVKATNPDGSVRMAVLTLQQPALAAGASTGVVLTLAPTTPAASPAVDLSRLVQPGAGVTVDIAVHGGGTYHLDAGALLAAALKAGKASPWLTGPQVSEMRVDAPVTGSLHVTFDIRAYADGTTDTNVAFNNDIATGLSGGTLVYDTTIKQAGTTVLQQNNLTHYQYQTWNQDVWSGAGAPQVNIVHDIQALANTGAIQGYDLQAGVDPALLGTAAAQASSAAYTPLGNAGVLQYFGQTGGRPDIGPTTLWNTLWLTTQTQQASTHALQQAQAAGSVPWHFFDLNTGSYLTTTQNPTLWVDDLRAGTGGTTALAQPIQFGSDGNQVSGWSPDTAHAPSLSYDAYLLTGTRYDLDQLQAQATADILETWPGTRANGQDLVASGVANQVRSAAWSLRDLVQAAYVTPDASPLKAYLTTAVSNNLNYLLTQSQTVNEGQAAGYLDLSGSTTATWQQDYLASTLIMAAKQGNSTAQALEQWQVNFLAGRFLAGSQGFSPYDGSTYYLPVADANGTPYQTWAQIEAASKAAGVASDGTQWRGDLPADYLQSSYGVLSGLITVTQSPTAIKAFGWLNAHAPQVSLSSLESAPSWSIAPVLPDGKALGHADIHVSTDTIATVLRAGNTDTLIYAGSGNDTLIGGSATNLLFGGTGNNTITGGSGMDFLYGGTGHDTIYGGAGANYMDTSGGPTLIQIDPADVAKDEIANFRLGIDHLSLIGPAASTLSPASIPSQSVGGSQVLTLTPTHTVTLLGVSTSDTKSLFT